jgi:alpha-tubulin suppressor-like RCC1 family protein
MELVPEAGGEVFTWGSGEMGQLGLCPKEVSTLPRDSEGYPYQPTPISVKSLRGCRVTQVSGGDGHSLAVTTSGRIYSWGASACGQLGLQDIKEMPTDAEGYPYQPEPRLIETLMGINIVQVACGDAHSVALSSDGMIYSWGGGGCGQLGHPDTMFMPRDEDDCPYQPVPRLVEGLPPRVKAIACGKAHTAAVLSEGLLYTWGAGACGQLGHPDTSCFPIDEDGYPYHPTPKLVTGLRNAKIVKAACGDVHSLALTAEGALYCFGGGSFGQLGLGNIKNLPVDVDDCPFMPVPKHIDTFRHIKLAQVACGDSHSVAVTFDGEFYAWGAAACGQLGIEDFQHLPRDGDNSPFEPEPQLVRSLRGKRIQFVSCGEAHTIALSDKGALYVFGASSCGQLGILPTEIPEVKQRRSRRSDSEVKPVQFNPNPQLVTSLLSRRIIAIASGGVHNVIVVESMPFSLAADLFDCYRRGVFTDCRFELASGTESIHCHKIVLAARSEYFHRQLQTTDAIKVPNSKAAMLKLVEYFYLDDAELLLESVAACNSLASATELLHFAHKFQLTDLHSACMAKITQHLRLHQPPQMPAELTNQLGCFVFLPDGRAALMSPKVYAEVVNKSVVVDLSAQEDSSSHLEQRTPLGKDLLPHLNDSAYSDVVIVVEGQELLCHKVVLAARSQYFAALYSHNFKESSENRVELMDVSYRSILSLLHLFYSDDLPIKLDSVPDLLLMCDRFSVRALKARCESELIQSLQLENAALLLKYAKNYQCERLKEACITYISENFAQVVETQAFEDLDKEDMLELMRYMRLRSSL